MLPHVISLNNYNIEVVGERTNQKNTLNLDHITELDLTDNLLSDWTQVFLIFKEFPSLEFLNLTNNLLTETCCSKYVTTAQNSFSIRYVSKIIAFCWCVMGLGGLFVFAYGLSEEEDKANFFFHVFTI